MSAIRLSAGFLSLAMGSRWMFPRSTLGMAQDFPAGLRSILAEVGQAAIEVKCGVDGFREFVTIFRCDTSRMANFGKRFSYLRSHPYRQPHRCLDGGIGRASESLCPVRRSGDGHSRCLGGTRSVARFPRSNGNPGLAGRATWRLRGGSSQKPMKGRRYDGRGGDSPRECDGRRGDS